MLAAEGLQDQLAATQAQLTAARSQQQQLQQELQQARGKASQLEYELHGGCASVCLWEREAVKHGRGSCGVAVQRLFAKPGRVRQHTHTGAA